MTNNQKIIIAYSIAINCLAYIMMCYDKVQSKLKGTRISERSLFLLACILGSIGIYVGMKAPLYHKASKKHFRFGIPFLIMLNVVLFIFLFRLLQK